MRFKLRQNVKFHDGTPFTADDVVFSFERALLPTPRTSSVYPQGVKEAQKVDDFTVDIITEGPNPVLLRAAHRGAHDEQGVVDEAQRRSSPQDYKNKEETFAARNANGTGPFMLKSREADVKTVLVLNSELVGQAARAT